jgi:F-type H+-transporting ATPase subunit b
MAEKNAKNAETLEHVPSTEHGGGFPPFQKDTFASQLIWFALAFVALYLLMSRIALPRIAAILESRRGRIDADLADAERLRGESAEASAAYEKALADARTRAQTLAAKAREKQAAEAEAARKELDAKLNARIAEATKGIREKQAAAMANVHAIGVEAATAILERLVGRAPGAAEVEAAVTDALKP